MRATFSGFEVARTGIQSAQLGLEITGQNMAKMNVEGYSRQLLSQSTIYHGTTSNKYAPLAAQKFGQGVTYNNLEQARDKFLDSRYRTANSESKALTKSGEILKEINDIFDETLTDGLSVTFEEFYERLQNLSSNAGDIEFSGLARSAAQKITESLSYYHNQLDSIINQQQYDLSISVRSVNTLIGKIDDVNRQIQNEMLFGNPTNDLLDMRSNYLDELSGQINISVEENMDGTLSVKTGDTYLVDTKNAKTANITLSSDSGVFKLQADGADLEVTAGETAGFLESLNGKGIYAKDDESNFKGVRYYMMSLDFLASKFGEVMNSLNGTDKPLFTGNTASTIAISEGWSADAGYIVASTSANPETGNNDNILRMITALDEKIKITENFSGSISEFASSLMYDAAIDYNFYTDLSASADTILSTVDNQRSSVKGVSLNEETVNLIKYQKAFEASARVMTVLDEMLDTIVNRMGV